MVEGAPVNRRSRPFLMPAALAFLLMAGPQSVAQQGFVPLGNHSPSLTQSQIDAILRSSGGPGSMWSKWLPSGNMAGLPGGLGYGLGWMKGFAGSMPRLPNGRQANVGDMAALMELMKGFNGPGMDPTGLKKMLESLGGGVNGFQGIGPQELKNWIPLLANLGGNKDLLKNLHPDLNWAKLGPLLEKLSQTPGAGLKGGDLKVLGELLERLTKPGVATPFGIGDVGTMMSLLDRIKAGNSSFPNLGPGSFGGMPNPGRTLESLGITPENLGKLTEFLKRMGLNTTQIEQLSSLLAKIPAPGMQGDLGHWLAKFDWDKLQPGKWQGLFPKWSLDFFQRIKPRFDFLKGIKFPSFNFRPPSLSLPSAGGLSMPSFSLPDRNTLIALGCGIGLVILLVWGYLFLVRVGLAPDLKKVLGIGSYSDAEDPVERFRLVYEGFALELLGDRAASFHHQRLAQGLQDTFPGRAGQLSHLGDLYERARYLPGTLRPTQEQALEGLQAIALLAKDWEKQYHHRGWFA